MKFARSESVTPTSRLLMRTIGVRDLVLGLGTVIASMSDSDNDVRRWTMMTLASDSLDTVVGLASSRAIGKRDAWAASGLAFAFVCADVAAIRHRSEWDPSRSGR